MSAAWPWLPAGLSRCPTSARSRTAEGSERGLVARRSGDGSPPLGRGVERAGRSARIEFRSRCDGSLSVAEATPKLVERASSSTAASGPALACRTPNERLAHPEKHAEAERQNSEML